MNDQVALVEPASGNRVWSRSTLLLFQVLGQKIVLARRRKRWTEVEVAHRARISRTTLSKIERGHGNVAFGSVLEVCWVLGISVLGAATLKEAEALLRDTQLQVDALPARVRSRAGDVPSDAF